MSGVDPLDLPSFRFFLEEAARWRNAKVDATNVVKAAVDALLDGVDSASFVLVAALGAAEAETELGELLDRSLDDLNIDLLGLEDPVNDVLAAAATCRDYLNGLLDHRQLTERIHEEYGHCCHPLVESLSSLCDMFETLKYGRNVTLAELEQETHQAASSISRQVEHLYRRQQMK